MTGPSPDKELWLVPAAVRKDLLNGFTRELWTPSKEELLTLDYEELVTRQTKALI